jgi:regulator of sigma E protease
MQTVIAIVIILGLIITIHEYGHLIFARRAGILCREFAIGFGPKLFSFKKTETVYTVRLLPIGGFVRMAGEDPETVEVKPGHRVGLIFNDNGEVSKIIINNKSKHPEAKVITIEEADIEKGLYIKGFEGEDGELQTYDVSRESYFVVDGEEMQIAPYDRQFASKSVGARLLAIFAGPLMNFVLAFVLFILYAMFNGIPVDDARLGMVTEDGAAIEAGLKQGDQVISVDGQMIGSWSNLVAVIKKNPGDTIQFTVERDGEKLEVPVTPKERELQNGAREGFIGVYQPTETSIIGSVKFGAEQIVFTTKLIFISVGKLITGQFGIDSLAGPVGIYSMTDQVAENGIFNLIRWAALLSVNVGIFNLLPLPALDGGRLIFLGLEAVRGKPVNPQKEALVHFVGFALLFVLMIVVTWNDIQRFFLN